MTLRVLDLNLVWRYFLRDTAAALPGAREEDCPLTQGAEPATLFQVDPTDICLILGAEEDVFVFAFCVLCCFACCFLANHAPLQILTKGSVSAFRADITIHIKDFNRSHYSSALSTNCTTIIDSCS